MPELRGLSNETAEAILNAIKVEVGKTSVSSKLLELAQAYATVVDAAPRPKPAAPRRAANG